MKAKNKEFDEVIELIMTGKLHLSFSALKSFLQSPKHFYAYKTDKTVTTAMTQGKIFHLACLEPDKFKQQYWVLEDSDKCAELIKGGAKSPRATSDYKAWVATETIKHEGQEMLSKDDYDTYLAMGNYLYECSATKELMSGLIAKEEPFDMAHDGFWIKGQVDGRGADYLIDLKKVSDASFKKVKWLIGDSFYDMQASMYCQATGHSNYYLIFIDASCNVTVVKLSKATLDTGWNKFTVGLDEFTRCAEENAWSASYEFSQGNYIEV